MNNPDDNWTDCAYNISDGFFLQWPHMVKLVIVVTAYVLFRYFDCTVKERVSTLVQKLGKYYRKKAAYSILMYTYIVYLYQ